MKVLVLFSLLFGFTLAHAETVTGEVFEMKSNFSKKLFTMDIQVDTQDGMKKTLAVYKDLQGQPAVEEKGVVKGTAELVSFDVDQKQTGEKGRIEVQDDKVLFTYEKDGKKKTSDEKLKGPVVTPANFNFYIGDHWNEISVGKEIEIRFGVWFRLETVGFKIFKVGETQKDGRKLIQLRMKPSSFVIAAIVDPLNLWYTEDGKKLVELSGRVSPKIKKGDSWKDLDADVRYLH